MKGDGREVTDGGKEVTDGGEGRRGFRIAAGPRPLPHLPRVIRWRRDPSPSQTRRMRIRLATSAELPTLRDIESAAGAAFRDVGMAEVDEHEPPSVETLERYRRAGRAWVACDDTDRPVAYVICEPVDGALHVEQISVHPDFAHRRIGRDLLAHADTHAREQRLPALTLTTFTDVPWNAPYYARLGFRTLADPELTPGLREIRAHEKDLGLDKWPRVCMRRDTNG